jgi:hypothetical protein
MTIVSCVESGFGNAGCSGGAEGFASVPELAAAAGGGAPGASVALAVPPNREQRTSTPAVDLTVSTPPQERVSSTLVNNHSIAQP